MAKKFDRGEMGQRAAASAAQLASKLWDRRAEIIRTTASAVDGFVSQGVQGAKDSASYLLYSEKAREELLEEEQRLRGEYRALVLHDPKRWRTVDTVSVGGLLLADILSVKAVPHEIELAFTAAYPNAYSTWSTMLPELAASYWVTFST
jgi:hypothetical protein